MTDPGRHAVLFVVFCLLAWGLVATSGLTPILAFEHDEEVTGASFGASDLSVTVESARVAPESVTTGEHGTVAVELPVRAAAEVDRSAFSLSAADGDRRVSIPAPNVVCAGECRLTVPARTIRRLVDGPGEHELVVEGWWTYDRRFVARVTVTVVAGGPTDGTTAPNASDTPSNTTTTVNGTQSNATTASPTAPSTATPTPQATPTPSTTPTPQPTASPTPTPQPTASPTPRSANSTTTTEPA